MQLLSRSPQSLLALVAVTGLIGHSHAGPVPNDVYQQLMQIPASSPSTFFNSKEPFTPDHRDPWDHKVDAIGEDREPLPWRMGDGASVMGPRNKDRERQNPDLVRPPSTDHGSLPNMRWSFADSHVRIEVRGYQKQITTRMFR